MNIKESHTVPPLIERIRLSNYLSNIFNTLPAKKGIKKAIKKNLVLVDGVPGHTGDYLKGGEVVDLLFDETIVSLVGLKLDLEVLFEDQFLAIVKKPPGIIVSGNKRRTIENALAHNLYSSINADRLPKMQAIHRLDYPTSGVLLVGKTQESVYKLNKLFENRKIRKSYLAITIGEGSMKGAIHLPIDGKIASSYYNIITSKASNKYNQINLVNLVPETGRRHQLRIHMASLGMPIMGDRKYNPLQTLSKGSGLFLFAHSLSFTHPFTSEELEISATVPNKFSRFFDIPAMSKELQSL